MKFNTSKQWFEKSARLEGDSAVGAGIPTFFQEAVVSPDAGAMERTPTQMLTPYARTKADWYKRPREQTLEWYEDAHKRNGFVFSTPDFYVMGRPVMKGAPDHQIKDVLLKFPPRAVDTWYVFLLCGDPVKAWSILPFELPWICWKRDTDESEELRFYDARTIRRLSGASVDPSPIHAFD
jgi:hypothetical protein